MRQINLDELVKSSGYDIWMAPTEDPSELNVRIRRENWRFYIALLIVVAVTVMLTFAYFNTGGANTRVFLT